jgi:hypothetical protein
MKTAYRLCAGYTRIKQASQLQTPAGDMKRGAPVLTNGVEAYGTLISGCF